MTTLRIRLLFNGIKLGPGKAELMERIRDTGSISAAGRQMEMSYKRAWMLVEEMNAAFKEPLVASSRGGPGGGGAHLTPMGAQVLHQFRALEAAARTATAPHIAALEAMQADIPSRK
ncbi:MAG: LysR family transcriptional regulator [Paracoccaceae bacterium]